MAKYQSAVVVLLSLLVVAPASRAWTVSSSMSGRSSFALRAAVNNNIVLKPSTDPGAFDNFKIGGARVHRYSRDSGPDKNDAEYIMWYHGRSTAMDAEKNLPPLSTGRIGRASSRNGLIWNKLVEGSMSEDAPDVSLGRNNESWWGFDTAHVGLGQVLLPMTTPAVISEGGVYLMYYMGGSFEDTPVTDYLNNVPESADNAKIKGMKMKIGVALSQDGASWGRIEGDDASGACVAPYDASDPNMKGVANQRDDDDSLLNLEEELYCGWPEVAVKIAPEGEEVMKKGKETPSFFMFYSTMRKSDKQKCIALAVSTDGFRWMKRGNVLTPDDDTLDAGGCARCNVIQKASYDVASRAWATTDGWIMFYEGVSKEDNKHRIMMAESMDARKWTKRGVAFDVGESDDAWDCAGVGSPHIIRYDWHDVSLLEMAFVLTLSLFFRLDDGTSRMYYTGQGADGSTAIGVAKVELGGALDKWTREQATIVFA
jgi:hypothetical protein